MADVSPLQATMHPVNSGGAFAIISGENPKYIPEVTGGHKGLEQFLNQGGFQFQATDGDHGENIHSPVFLIHNLGRDQAMEIGRRLGQESIVYSNNGQHELIYTNGPNAGKYHPTTGEAMRVFPVRPDDGLTTRIPGLGHVRFSFDLGKLLDVPQKGSAMSEDTKKAEVSVAELKKKLADTLKKKINELSKSMEEFATRETESNDEASVGDLKLTKSELSLQSSDADWHKELGIELVKGEADVCPICGDAGACACLLKNVSSYPKLTKSHTLAIAAAMQKIYHSYLNNVAKPQFPNDPERQHQLALAAAKDWASRAADPSKVYETALGYNPDDPKATEAAVGHAPAQAAPDSLGPDMTAEKRFPGGPSKPQPQVTAHGGPIVKGEMCKGCGLEKCGCSKAELGKAGLSMTGTSTPGLPTPGTSALTGRKYPEPSLGVKQDTALPTMGAQNNLGVYRGESAKQTPAGMSTPQPHAPMTQGTPAPKAPAAAPAAPSTPAPPTAGAVASAAPMGKEEAKFTPTPGSKTQRRKQNLIDRKRTEKLGTKEDVARFDATTRAMAERRKGVSLQSSEAEWKAELGKNDLEKWCWVPPKDPKPKPDDDKKKSEDFIDLKNANDPKKRLKNVGAETPKPAEPTKEVKGNLDDGSGGTDKDTKLGKEELGKNFSAGGRLVMGRGDPRRFPVKEGTDDKGNKTIDEIQSDKTPKPEKKTEMGGLAPGGGAENPAIAPLAQAQPPMAKPPSKNPTPAAPPASKPKLPKTKLGKAAIPMAGTRTRAGAADAQASSIRGGHEIPGRPAAAPAAPKIVPKPASEFSDFMPAGKFTQAGSGLPTPAVPPKPAPGTMAAGPKVPGSKA